MMARMNMVYGIPNCDTVKRARVWLAGHDVPFQFHDFKKHGVPEVALDRWLGHVGWEALVNRRGTTWRQLDDVTRASVTDTDSARVVLLANASLIKRPVVEWHAAARITVGFDADLWATF